MSALSRLSVHLGPICIAVLAHQSAGVLQGMLQESVCVAHKQVH